MESFSASALLIALLQVSCLLDQTNAMEVASQDFSEYYIHYTLEDTLPAGNNIQRITIGLVFIISLAVGCALNQKLLTKDKQLPAEKRVMNFSMSCAYWLVCFCFGCIGSIVFYLIAQNQIETRIQVQNINQPQIPVAMAMNVPQQNSTQQPVIIA